MIIYNNRTPIVNFHIKNDNAYRYERFRTGIFAKESDDFVKKYKIKNILSALNKLNIEFQFDAFNTDNSRFALSVSGTNYGVILRVLNSNFEPFLFKKYFYNKSKLVKNIDTNLEYNSSCIKYNNNKKIFDKKIKKLGILSSVLKHKLIDWNILNTFMYDDDTYLKAHPIMDRETILLLARKYGKSKIIDSTYALDPLIEKANTVAVSSCSESIITIKLLNKKIVFLNKPYSYYNQVKSTYFLLYYGIYNNFELKEILDTACIGLIPWSELENINFINELINFNMKEYASWQDSCYNYTIDR